MARHREMSNVSSAGGVRWGGTGPRGKCRPPKGHGNMIIKQLGGTTHGPWPSMARDRNGESVPDLLDSVS